MNFAVDMTASKNHWHTIAYQNFREDKWTATESFSHLKQIGFFKNLKKNRVGGGLQPSLYVRVRKASLSGFRRILVDGNYLRG